MSRSTSSNVAPPRLTTKPACFSLTCAPPTNVEGAVVQSMLEGFEEPEPQPIQGSLFDGLEGFEDLAPVEEKPQDTVPLCIIYDWESNEPFEFAALKGGM